MHVRLVAPAFMPGLSIIVALWLGTLSGCLDHEEDGDAPDQASTAKRASQPLPRPRAAPGSAVQEVTLITGDRVVVWPGGAHSIEPGPGRFRGAFRTYTVDGHLSVVPVDALPLLASGALDRRLFDVTELIALGYDDARRADIPLIVTYGPGVRSAADSALAAGGARASRSLTSIGAAAVRQPKANTAATWSAVTGSAAALSAPGAKIWLDGKCTVVLDRSVPQIGAPAAWAAGYTGAGVTVAVLDTGIASDHPDFAGRIVEEQSFVEDSPDATDRIGHGTHVASILAGSGAGEGGRYRGVAPEAELLIGKVCDESGCPDSAVIAGMEWAAEAGASVVNLSLGRINGPEIDPLEAAIDALTAQHGTLFVVAAGNDGEPATVGSPSTADAALSVAAVDVDDQLAYFSSQGPRAGDGGVKPEISAPGVSIVAARAAGTPLGDNEPVGELYARLSGTSMATPHVAGAAALLAQKNRSWRAEQLKAALTGSARPNRDLGVFQQGAGRVDVARAVLQTATATPATLLFGRTLYPHEDDEPIRKKITYRNDGTARVVLNLATDATDATGAPAPPGMFTVRPRRLAIPPGRQVRVTVTADSRLGGDGVFSGVIAATGWGVSIRTPFSLEKEAESYDLEVTYRFRDASDGAPRFTGSHVLDLDSGEVFDAPSDGAASRIRLPRGRYHVEGAVLGGEPFGPDPEARWYDAIFMQPLLDLDRETVIVMDANEAQPTDVDIPPHPSARLGVETWVTMRSPPSVSMVTGSAYPRLPVEPEYSRFYTKHLGPEVPEEEFWTVYGATWAEPGPADSPYTWSPYAESPYAYWVSFVAGRGRFPDGIVRQFAADDLATVVSHYTVGADYAGAEARSTAWRIGMPTTGLVQSVWFSLPFLVPGTRTDYYATSDDIGWASAVTEFDEFYRTGTVSRMQVFSPGHGETTWGKGVVGPSSTSAYPDLGGAPTYDLQPLASRSGDFLVFNEPALFADQEDHFKRMFTAQGEVRVFDSAGELLFSASGFANRASVSLPPERARYRVEQDFTAGGPTALSTAVRMAWTFESGHVSETERVPLPVMSVRFAPPDLDQYNRSAGARSYTIPFTITRQPGSPVVPVTDFTAEFSVDGGETWQAAAVTRDGDTGTVQVEHPAADATVSLRVTARDEDGNQLEQTVLDGYHVSCELGCAGGGDSAHGSAGARRVAHVSPAARSAPRYDWGKRDSPSR